MSKIRVVRVVNQQVLPPRRDGQRATLERVLALVSMAEDCVVDVAACGSDAVASWLDPARLRLRDAQALLRDVLREGGRV